MRLAHIAATNDADSDFGHGAPPHYCNRLQNAYRVGESRVNGGIWV